MGFKNSMVLAMALGSTGLASAQNGFGEGSNGLVPGNAYRFMVMVNSSGRSSIASNNISLGLGTAGRDFRNANTPAGQMEVGAELQKRGRTNWIFSAGLGFGDNGTNLTNNTFDENEKVSDVTRFYGFALRNMLNPSTDPNATVVASLQANAGLGVAMIDGQADGGAEAELLGRFGVNVVDGFTVGVEAGVQGRAWFQRIEAIPYIGVRAKVDLFKRSTGCSF